MSLEDMAIIFTKIFDYCQKNSVESLGFTFTGGELFTLGHDYFSSLMALQQRIFKDATCRIENSIQTNLTLLDDGWLALIKKYHLEVGTSFDPYSETRVFASGQPIDDVFIDKLLLLANYTSNFSLIVMLTPRNYKNIVEIYQNLNTAGISFSPIVVDLGSAAHCPELCLSAEQYAESLKALTAEYLREDNRIFVGVIESYITALTSGLQSPAGYYLCRFVPDCFRSNIFIENNGDVFACDILRNKDFQRGNILTDTFESLINSPVSKLLRERRLTLKKDCEDCKYNEICNGGCPGFALAEGNILRKSEYHCRLNRIMFEYISQKLKERNAKLFLERL